MNEMTLQDGLVRLGLSDHEALVYSALLSQSPASATMLAKKANLARSSVYTTLGALSSKGLVSTTLKNGIRQFSAEDETALEHLLKKEQVSASKKLVLFDKVKLLLTASRQPPLSLPSISFFEGQDGLRRIYLSMMRNAPHQSTRYLLRDEFVWDPTWEFIFSGEWHQRINRIKNERSLKTQLLINPSPLEKSKASYYKKQKGVAYRFLQKDAAIESFALYCIGDSTAILSIEKNNLVGVLISNRHLTHNFTQLFKSLWKTASSH